ncbi:hypothetical protein, partial [Stutzerimonas stutzeri]|uniref:hypothetical protein n=1 Tax=Stutzerimonas stutzeri TaxID=316 RepID=UPI003CFC61E3
PAGWPWNRWPDGRGMPGQMSVDWVAGWCGIRRLDRYFSKKHDPNWESNSPFESFYRLHKYSFLYSFGINRPKVNKAISLWLYFSSFSLSCIWVSLGLAAAGKYFDIGPFS